MSTFSNYNSNEYQVVKEVFNKLPMMDTYISNIIEEYIYKKVEEIDTEGHREEYIERYGKREGEYKKWYLNGQLWSKLYFKEGKLDGEYKEWYSNGQLFCECYYKEGELDREYKKWYRGADGQIERQCFYKEGKLDGELKYWDENGQLLFQKCYKGGKYHGEHKLWFHNGEFRGQCFYKEGKLDGEWIYLDENRIVYQGYYIEGKFVKYKWLYKMWDSIRNTMFL